MKEKIARWYNQKKADGARLWTKEIVRDAVRKGIITPEDFAEITGEAYE